jgi:hypothetical protein
VGYDDIRAALGSARFVDNLNLIARLCHGAMTSDSPCHHPSALYAIAVTAEKLAAAYESAVWTDDTASKIEAHIRPHLETVLEAIDGDEPGLLAALDALARCYAQVRPLL